MDNGLTALEEFNAQRKLKFPHCLYPASDPAAARKTAYAVLAKKPEEILLIEPDGFGESSVIVGMSQENFEYFAKNAPLDYKKIMLEAFYNKYTLGEVAGIAKEMDADMGTDANTKRVRGIIRYVRDNEEIFRG